MSATATLRANCVGTGIYAWRRVNAKSEQEQLAYVAQYAGVENDSTFNVSDAILVGL